MIGTFTWQEVAAICTIASLASAGVYHIITKIFGAGRVSAKYETAVSTASDIKIKAIETSIGEAIRGFREQLHLTEKRDLETRLHFAETYMRRDSYYAAMGDLKKEIHDSISGVHERLGRMEDLMLSVKRDN